VPGLRFFVCEECGTVYADVERVRCRRCDDGPVEELGPGRQAFDYFTGN
jgi:formate dehydrogenase maturation protein FdhE